MIFLKYIQEFNYFKLIAVLTTIKVSSSFYNPSLITESIFPVCNIINCIVTNFHKSGSKQSTLKTIIPNLDNLSEIC